MSLKRVREYPTKQQFESTDDFAKRLRDAVQEEATDRIQDFDILQLGNVPWVDVREYGAKGDDSTDDTVAIQAALDQDKKVYIPGGYTFLASNLTLPTGVTIFGDGWSSIIKHQASATDHLIELEGVNVYGTMIKDIFINGNKANQSNSVDIINFDNTAGAFTYWDDPLHTLSNVFIYQPQQDGIHFAGGADATQGCYLSNVQVYQANRYGLYLNGADNVYVGCVAGNCDNHGFYIDEGSSSFIGCMGYGSGVDAVASVDGFYVGANAAGTRMIGCHGQENKRYGIHLYGGGGHILTGCLTDANLDTGVELANSTQYNTITGHKSNSNVTDSITIGAGCKFNKIQAMVGTGAANSVIVGDASNAIEINNQMGYQAIAFATTITPDPYIGSHIYIGAMTEDLTTFNVPAAAHGGMRMTLAFLQDGSGGWTVTLGAGYKHTWTPAETASKYDIIEFEYDGSNWIEISSTVGVG